MAEPLTRREIEVLRLFRSDLSLRDIGNELDITLNTAKGYAKTIYRKLAINSRAEAVSVATQAGLI
ncbi:MAG: response regulator transcription factor [Actinomycetia bacterium]|nr:response regulator transcription factor [Actinomycetes bacterium]